MTQFRDYEISIWTLQDEFISILKPSNIEWKGLAQNNKVSFKTDGTQTCTFSVPKFINIDKQQHVLNPYWGNTKNGNLSKSLHKIKIIFNKQTNIEKVYEFVIIDVKDRHEEDQVFCDVSCEGLAFHELGKRGYKISLSSEVMNKEAYDWFVGDQSDSEPRPTLQYWNESQNNGLHLTKVPTSGFIDRSVWYYDIQMDWSSYEAGRDSDKVYEEEYVSSWINSNNKMIPLTVEGKKEKERFVDIEESNIYNITQKLAEVFGVFCKYEYLYDNTYHIIGRRIIYYNNFINEKEGYFDLTYPYSTSSIIRTLASQDITTKMFINISDNEDITITDVEANKSKEDYLLNFDYLYKTGDITKEQYDEIETYQAVIRTYNDNLIDYSNKLNVLQNRQIKLKAHVVQTLNSVQLDKERIENADNLLNSLDVKDADADGAITVDASHPDQSIMLLDDITQRYYINITQIGVLPDTLRLYRTLNYASASVDNILSNEITTGVITYDEYGNVTGVTDLTLDNNNSKIVYLTYKYKPQLQYEKVKQTWQVRLARDTQEYETSSAALDILENQISTLENQYNNLLEQKRSAVNDFDQFMGPALRESFWRPEDYKDYGNKYNDILSTGSTDGASGYTNFLWDTNSYDDEQKASYKIGIEQTTLYYPCIDLSPYLNNIKTHIDELSFLFYDYNKTDLENPELNRLRALSVGSLAQYGFVQVGAIIKPVLILVGAQSMTQESLNRLVTKNPVVGNVTTSVSNLHTVITDLTTYFEVSANDFINLSYDNASGNYSFTEVTICYPRIKINSLKLKDNDTDFILKYNNVDCENYQDYYLLIDTDETTGKSFYYATIKPQIILKQGSLNFNYNLYFVLSNADIAIYLDAMSILRENSIPKVSYQINPSLFNPSFIQTAYNQLNRIVNINDTELQLKDVQGYITQVDLDLDEPQNDKYEIADYRNKFEDLFSTIVAQTEAMQKSATTIDLAAAALTASGLIDQQVLQNTLRRVDLDYAFNNGNLTIDEENGIWGISDSGVVAFRGGGIFTATEQDGNGNWKWNTGIVPEGINADLITTGQLDTNLIKIYGGDKVRFQLNGDGLFAYKSIFEDRDILTAAKMYSNVRTVLENNENKDIDKNQYVVHNENGLFLIAKKGAYILNTNKDDLIALNDDVARVEISWDGLKLRNWNNEEVFYADPDTGNLTLHGRVEATAFTLVDNSTGAQTTIDNYINNTISDRENIQVFYSEIAPSSGISENDIWYDIDANPVKVYKYNGTTWDDITSTALAQALISGYTAGKKADKNATDLSNAITTINGDITDLQTQIDGNITTWFYSGIPTISSLPASEWTTEEEKNHHIGDLYYNTATGYCYHWILNGSTYKWERIIDNDVTQALADAAAAQSTADGKIKTYIANASNPTAALEQQIPVSTIVPTTSLDEGDLWINSSSDNALYRYHIENNSGSWVLVQDTHLDEDVQTLNVNAVVSSEVEYGTSTSNTIPPASSSWSTTTPSWSANTYVWMRTKTVTMSGTTTYFPNENGICIQAAAARSIVLTGESAFLRDVNNNNITTPNSITLTATVTNLTIGKWYYKNGSDSWIEINGKNGQSTYQITPSTANIWNNNKAIIKVEDTTTNYSDIKTIVLVTNGANGSDAKYVSLTNENISFSADASGKVNAHTFNIGLEAYEGITPVTPVVSTVSGSITGQLTVTAGTAVNNVVPITVATVSGQTLNSQNSGVISITITSPLSTTLTINWNKVSSGSNGRGISSTEIKYAKSSSGTTVPTSWGSTVPTITPTDIDRYLWTRTTITYTDNSAATVSYSIAYHGTDGSDGTSITILGSYDTLADLQAAHPTGEVGDGYIVGTHLYIWSADNSSWIDVGQIKGDDGQDGLPTYVHFAYATNSTGTENFSTNAFEGATYLGVYSDNVQADSQTPSDYIWSLIKGADGSSPTLYELVVSNSSIIKDVGSSNLYTPANITLSATYQIGNGEIQAFTDGTYEVQCYDGSNWTVIYPTSNGYIIPTNIAVTMLKCLLYLDNTKTILLDQQTIPIISEGQDAYTIILSNENHSFSGDNVSAIPSSVNSEIYAYKGITRIPATIGIITGQPAGMTTSISNNDSVSASFTVSVTSEMTSKNGVLNVPIIIDNKTFNMKFSYSLTLAGADGENGISATRYFTLCSTDTITRNHIYTEYYYITSDASDPRAAKIGIAQITSTRIDEFNNVYTPKTLTINAYSQTGSEAISDYLGRIKIERTTDNETWTTVYQSTTNESSYEYVFSVDDTTIAYRYFLYAADGFITILDQGTIPVITAAREIVATTPLYRLENSTTPPNKPTSKVTSTLTDAGIWTTSVPQYINNYYYFRCYQNEWNDNTVDWSEPSIDYGITVANQTATTASTEASAVVNYLNSAFNVSYNNGVFSDYTAPWGTTYKVAITSANGMLLGSSGNFTIANGNSSTSGAALVMNSGGIALHGASINLTTANDTGTSVIALTSTGITIGASGNLSIKTSNVGIDSTGAKDTNTTYPNALQQKTYFRLGTSANPGLLFDGADLWIKGNLYAANTYIVNSQGTKVLLDTYFDNMFETSAEVTSKIQSSFNKAADILNAANTSLSDINSYTIAQTDDLYGFYTRIKENYTPTTTIGTTHHAFFKEGDIWKQTDANNNVINVYMAVSNWDEVYASANAAQAATALSSPNGWNKTYNGSFANIIGANINVDAAAGTIDLSSSSSLNLASSTLNLTGSSSINIATNGVLNLAGNAGINLNGTGKIKLVSTSGITLLANNDGTLSKFKLDSNGVELGSNAVIKLMSGNDNGTTALELSPENGIRLNSSEKITLFSGTVGAANGAAVEISKDKILFGVSNTTSATTAVEMTKDYLILAAGNGIGTLRSNNITLVNTATGLKLTKDGLGFSNISSTTRNVVLIDSTGIRIASGTSGSDLSNSGSIITISPTELSLGSLANLNVNTNNVKISSGASGTNTVFGLGTNLNNSNANYSLQFANGALSITGAITATSFVLASGASITQGTSTYSLSDMQNSIDSMEATSIVVQYTTSTSSSTTPTSGWSSSRPASINKGEYLWTWTRITYGNNTYEDSYQVSYQGQDGTNGTNGTNGLNVATVFLYQRAASTPSKPSAEITYTFATGAVSGLTNNWTKDIPTSNSNPCYVIQATASSTSATDSIAANEWSNPVILVQNGANGTNGTDGNKWYTGTTAPGSAGILSAINIGDMYLDTTNNYVYRCTAAGTSSSTATWTYQSNIKGAAGTNGDNGYNTATVYLYQRATSSPSKPSSALTYTFSTKALSGTLGNWTQTIPSGTNPIYVIVATAYSNTDTDSIAANEWSSPVVLAQNGTNGDHGLNVATVFLYQRTSSTPTKPSSAITYTFATGAVSGLTNSWTKEIPTSNGNPCYVIQATASSTEATDSIAASEWSDPIILVQNGTNGTNGESVASITEYYLATSASSGVTTSTSGWTTSIQTTDTQNRYLWNYEVVTGSKGSTLNTTTPVIIGTYGDTGVSITSVTEYYLATSASSGVTTSTTGWTTTIQTTDAQKRYLWNYEVVTGSNNTTLNTTTPSIINTYVEDGTPGSKWYSGTALSGATSSAATGISYANIGDMYLDTDSNYIYECTTAGASGTAVWTRRNYIKGDSGGIWYSGTAITGVNTTAQIFNGSGISYANVGDMYLNTETSNTYKCTVAGNASTAKWIYVNNIKGQTGDTGVSVTSITNLYAKSGAANTSASGQPLKPTSEITTTSTEVSYNVWSKSVPTFSGVYPYYWRCEQIVWSDNTMSWSNPYVDKGITDANQQAYSASTIATNLQTNLSPIVTNGISSGTWNGVDYGVILGNTSSSKPMLIGSNSGITIASDTGTGDSAVVVMNSHGIAVASGGLIDLNGGSISIKGTENGGSIKFEKSDGSLLFSLSNDGSVICQTLEVMGNLKVNGDIECDHVTHPTGSTITWYGGYSSVSGNQYYFSWTGQELTAGTTYTISITLKAKNITSSTAILTPYFGAPGVSVGSAYSLGGKSLNTYIAGTWDGSFVFTPTSSQITPVQWGTTAYARLFYNSGSSSQFFTSNAGFYNQANSPQIALVFEPQ